MKTPPWTPGPWEWVYRDATFSIPIALNGPDRDVLTCSEDEDGPRGYASPADLQLIAAGPTMAEALAELTQSCSCRWSGTKAAKAKARAALAADGWPEGEGE